MLGQGKQGLWKKKIAYALRSVISRGERCEQCPGKPTLILFSVVSSSVSRNYNAFSESSVSLIHHQTIPQQESSESTPVPASEAKAPIGDRLTELILQMLKPGGITVGSLTAFWHLLKQDSDVQRAIVAAGVGIGLSYVSA